MRSSLVLQLAFATAACSQSSGVPGDASAPRVDAGADHGAARTPDAGPPFASLPPWDGPTFVQVVTGRHHGCALTDGGEVYCWGSDQATQLGEGPVPRQPCGPPLTPRPCRPSAAKVPGLGDVVELAAGEEDTCALTAAGEVVCLGVLPRPYPWLEGVDHIRVGGGRLCGFIEGAMGRCVDLTSGERLDAFDRVDDLSVTTLHRCVLAGGEVSCQGVPNYGVLGVVPEESCDHRVPECEAQVDVDLPEPAIDVSVGGTTSCAALESGSVWCWGVRLDTDEISAPRQVPELRGARTVAVSSSTGVCAIDDDGVLSCVSWRPTFFFHPVAQPGIRQVDLDGGRRQWGPSSACALTDEGAVACWGRNAIGDLGRPPVTEEHLSAGWIAIGATTVPGPPVEEGGWEPIPALPPWCRVERATDPAALGALEVRSAMDGATRILSPNLNGREAWLGDTVSAADGGMATFATQLDDDTALYGMVSIETGEISSAVRRVGPWLRNGPEGATTLYCQVSLFVGDGVAWLRVDPSPYQARLLMDPLGGPGSTEPEIALPVLPNAHFFARPHDEWGAMMGPQGFWLVRGSEARRLNAITHDRIAIGATHAYWFGGARGPDYPLSLDPNTLFTTTFRGQPDAQLTRPVPVDRLALTDDAVVWIEASGSVLDGYAELWWAPRSADGSVGAPAFVRTLDFSASLRQLEAHQDWALVGELGALLLVHLPTGEERRLSLESGSSVEPRLLTETHAYFAVGGFRGDIRRIERTAL